MHKNYKNNNPYIKRHKKNLIKKPHKSNFKFFIDRKNVH